ncbi:MAG: protein TolR [Desulfobacteraceae bacterium]|nr:MAG: protein TolR [Desulfobacteraceae bacterium]
MALETNTDRLMSDINVTPFVDVMLVLLIIFMVTAPMMVQGVDVALPEATAKPLASQKDNLVITVNRQQLIHINDFEVESDYLRDKLMKILENRSDREVYFRADKEVPYGMVVQVMAEIKAAGVEKLGMITVPIEEDQRRINKQ